MGGVFLACPELCHTLLSQAILFLSCSITCIVGLNRICVFLIFPKICQKSSIVPRSAQSPTFLYQRYFRKNKANFHYVHHIYPLSNICHYLRWALLGKSNDFHIFAKKCRICLQAVTKKYDDKNTNISFSTLITCFHAIDSAFD